MTNKTPYIAAPCRLRLRRPRTSRRLSAKHTPVTGVSILAESPSCGEIESSSNATARHQSSSSSNAAARHQSSSSSNTAAATLEERAAALFAAAPPNLRRAVLRQWVNGEQERARARFIISRLAATERRETP